MSSNKLIALNFLPLTTQDFSFVIYRKKYKGEKSIGAYADCLRKNLPFDSSIDINARANRADYWISFTQMEGFEQFICKQDYNHWLTLDYVFRSLKKKCKANLPDLDYVLPEKNLRRFITFVLKSHKEGKETVWLEPYYLKSARQFGFLIDFEFKKYQSEPFSRKVQQLSLSLDKSFRSNRNFYIDRYVKIEDFLRIYYTKIFPVSLEDGVSLNIRKSLYELPADKLDVKKYIFANGAEMNSQFNGVKEYGPLEPVVKRVSFCFICRKQDTDFAQLLLRALRGDTFKTTFPGMDRVFDVPIERGLIKGKSLEEFNRTNLEEVVKYIRAEGDNLITFPIIIIPSKNDERSSRMYYLAKYLFINESIPLQVVTLDTLKSMDTLKWSIANIGLQIFAKLGGQPWKVKSDTENCLIIGVGQAHKQVKTVDGSQVEKYFAYSVLTDSSGIYLDLEVLGKSSNKQTYINQLKENLKRIISTHRKAFSKFVIHTPFKIKGYELDSIKESIESIKDEDQNKDIEFVVMKVNTHNKFFGYDLKSNSMVPFESSYLKLSQKEYLVWFEGLQYHNPNVYRRFSGPTHIEFYYSSRDLDGTEKSYLQGALNLSGANWRGFNAKSLPVSILYCQLVAKFIKEFNTLGHTDYEINNLKPWFL